MVNSAINCLRLNDLSYIIKRKANRGYCPICENSTIFIEYNSWLRDHYKCLQCHSIPRERALVNLLNSIFPDWLNMDIHESSPGSQSSNYISKKANKYSYSHYFTDTQLGTFKNGVRCENLEELTFEDNTFDIFITQDVFEHVYHPEKAFKEISRVLKPNGAHIFTVPYYPDLKESRPRITESGGDIIYLLEPLYHINPIDKAGSLVTYDYGINFTELIYKWSNAVTTVYVNKTRDLGLNGEFLEVFVSRKLS
jgi:SAM-dependent methyltransferase